MIELALMELVGLTFLGALAGWVGALVGIGGGIFIVPALVLVLGVPIKMAVATSLIAVVATSTAAGSVYVGAGLVNMRLAMTLEVATTLGGLGGGLLAVMVSPSAISGLFALLMAVIAVLMVRGQDFQATSISQTSSPGQERDQEGHEEAGALAGSFYDPYHQRRQSYQAVRLTLGSSVSFLAGILSGLLGVGGGFVKVPAMCLGMKVPMKVAAATSNFMIGVTALSSLFIYFAHGLILPFLAVPLTVGVVAGALVGSVHSRRLSPQGLRYFLAILLAAVAIQMGLKTWGISLGR